MKFKELIANGDFDCEVITEQEETNFTFCWNEKEYVTLTEEGKEKFSKILNSDCRMLKNGNILLLDKSVTYDELNLFLGSVAGYVAERDYHKWFKEVK